MGYSAFSRRFEAVIAGYFVLTAILFWTVPATLAPAVYAKWGALPPEVWAVVMAVSGGTHWAALWFNGRDRLISSTVRILACSTHLFISLVFGAMFFLSGLYWGCLLFWWLLPAHTLQVGQLAVTQLTLILNDREARYGHKGHH